MWICSALSDIARILLLVKEENCSGGYLKLGPKFARKVAALKQDIAGK